jgi:hypothetical protein
MIHSARPFTLVDETDPLIVADKLTVQTWTLCTAFRLRLVNEGRASEIILLNDSFSEDSAQEFAVYADGHLIESLTVSWMNKTDLACRLRVLLGSPHKPLIADAVQFAPRGHPDGYCRHCA